MRYIILDKWMNPCTSGWKDRRGSEIVMHLPRFGKFLSHIVFRVCLRFGKVILIKDKLIKKKNLIKSIKIVHCTVRACPMAMSMTSVRL